MDLAQTSAAVAAQGTQVPTVATPSAEYVAAEKARLPGRYLMAGTPGMREAGPLYLPRERGEEDDDYGNRLNRSVLFNAFGDGVEKLVGKVFSKPLALLADVPEEIRGVEETDTAPAVEGWAENIDLLGNNMHIFSMNVFRERVGEGSTAILVDNQQTVQQATANGKLPADPRLISVADVKRVGGTRPYWTFVRCRDLIEAHEEIINGKPTLVRARILENKRVMFGEWGQAVVKRIRVLWRGDPMGFGDAKYVCFRIYEERKEQDANGRVVVTYVPSTDPADYGYMRPQTEIPLVPVPKFFNVPELENLAYLNILHWQKQSDFDRFFHFVKINKLFWAGVDELHLKKQGMVGGNIILWSPKPPSETSLTAVQTSDAGVDHALKDMDRLEDKMRLAVLEPMLPKKTQTLGEKRIDTAEAHSTLQAWAISFKNSLENALMFTAKYIGKDTGGSVEINVDFGLNLAEVAILNHLMAMREFGDLSQDTLWAASLKQGALPEEFDPEKEKRLLEDERKAQAKDDLAKAEAMPQQQQGVGPDGQPAKAVTGKLTSVVPGAAPPPGADKTTAGVSIQ